VKSILFAFGSGLLFSLGLGVGGMTQPAKVVGFLDFFGEWDPSLIFVMGGAVAVYFVAFRLITKRDVPLFSPSFGIPRRRDIDLPLIGGAAMFGAGWGLAGYCPGPGIASLGSGSVSPIVFVAAMLFGMMLFRARDVFRERRAPAAVPADARLPTPEPGSER
jgi:uncharacterized membrane protein YedE/YeeE